MKEVEEKVLDATRRFLESRDGEPGPIGLDAAVCQDLLIFGVDVEEYVWALEEEFGKVVWTIPWRHYTDQTSSFRGCGGCLLFWPWLVLQFIRKILRGGPVIPRPHPREHPFRLTLREISEAIEAGGWSKEWRPE